MFDNTLDIENRYRVYAGKRFIEQYEQGVGGQGTGYLYAAPLAAREADAEARAYVPDM